MRASTKWREVTLRGRLTPASGAWLTLAAAVVAWEVSVPSQQLLSSECDRWIESRPIAGRVGIIGAGLIIIAHLANLVNPRYDVMSQGFILWGKLSRARARYALRGK